MKKNHKLWQIIVIVAVIGCVVIACDNGSSGGDDYDYDYDAGVTTYTVTYYGNGNTGGVAPIDSNSPYKSSATVTVLGNTNNLSLTGYSFAGWSTASDGNGTTYAVGALFNIYADTIFYAQWTLDVTYAVMYYGNGAHRQQFAIQKRRYRYGFG